MPRRTLVKERREGAVKLPHIKGEVCWGWGSLLVLFSATEKRTILLVLFKKNIFLAKQKENECGILGYKKKADASRHRPFVAVRY